MIESGKIKILREFFRNGCKNLHFDKCKELKEGHNKAAKAPGCSVCARRRARRNYSKLVREEIEGKDYKTIFPHGDSP